MSSSRRLGCEGHRRRALRARPRVTSHPRQKRRRVAALHTTCLWSAVTCRLVTAFRRRLVAVNPVSLRDRRSPSPIGWERAGVRVTVSSSSCNWIVTASPSPDPLPSEGRGDSLAPRRVRWLSAECFLNNCPENGIVAQFFHPLRSFACVVDAGGRMACLPSRSSKKLHGQ